MKNVVILGASPDNERYSHKAMKFLKEKGYGTILVSNKYDEIEGQKVFKKIEDITENYDAITLYLSPKISSSIQEEILNSKTKVLIFNPGTENPNLEKNLEKKNIKTINACTLVLLRTDQFESIF